MVIAANHFDHTLHGHGIHEVHAEDLRGPIGRRSDSCNGDGGSIGSKYRMFRTNRIDSLVDLFLDGPVFDYVFNDEINITQDLVIRRTLNVRESCICTHAVTSLHHVLKPDVLPNQVPGFCKLFLGNIHKPDAEISQGDAMSHSYYHHTRANNAYGFQFQSRFLFLRWLNHGYSVLSRRAGYA